MALLAGVVPGVEDKMVEDKPIDLIEDKPTGDFGNRHTGSMRDAKGPGDDDNDHIAAYPPSAGETQSYPPTPDDKGGIPNTSQTVKERQTADLDQLVTILWLSRVQNVVRVDVRNGIGQCALSVGAEEGEHASVEREAGGWQAPSRGLDHVEVPEREEEGAVLWMARD